MPEPSSAYARIAWVRKRDGRLVPFEADHISRSLFAAGERIGKPDPFMARELTDSVLHFLENPDLTPILKTMIVEASRPLASVEVAEVNADVVKRLDLPNRIRGVLVTKVDGEAGELRAGDVIEEVNQQPVTSVSEFKKVVAALDPNGTQVLSVCRHRTRSFVVVRPR